MPTPRRRPSQATPRKLNRSSAGAAVAANDPRLERGVEVWFAGNLIAERRRLLLVEGSNVTLTVADDAPNDQVTVTVASSSGGVVAEVISETGDPELLVVGAIPDGTYLKRVGNTCVGDTPPSGSAWTEVRKTGDQSRLSNITLTDDDTLVFPMAANTRYHVRGAVQFNTPAAADIKFSFQGPAGLVRMAIARYAIAGGATAFSVIAIEKAYGVSLSVLGTGADGRYFFDGTVENGATAGDFSLRWAQVTSTASNTTVQRGSFLEYVDF